MSLRLLRNTLAFFCLAIPLVGVAIGQSESTGEASSAIDKQAEIDAISKQSEAFEVAFNKQDAKAIAALWREDGEYVDVEGGLFAGRDAIEKCYEVFFAESPGTQISITIDSMRLIGPNAAIEDGTATLISGQGLIQSKSKYFAIHTKVDGRWLMASVRDQQREDASDVTSAADLNWLVGTWVTESLGVRSEFVCQWIVDDRFLERRYTTTQLNGDIVTGLQIIGWNPLNRCVQSWDFSSSGGHAIGVWSAIDGGWQADVRGVTAEGLTTSSITVLKRLDDNAYSWQSIRRVVGESELPDTYELVIKRIVID